MHVTSGELLNKILMIQPIDYYKDRLAKMQALGIKGAKVLDIKCGIRNLSHYVVHIDLIKNLPVEVYKEVKGKYLIAVYSEANTFGSLVATSMLNRVMYIDFNNNTVFCTSKLAVDRLTDVSVIVDLTSGFSCRNICELDGYLSKNETVYMEVSQEQISLREYSHERERVILNSDANKFMVIRKEVVNYNIRDINKRLMLNRIGVETTNYYIVPFEYTNGVLTVVDHNYDKVRLNNELYNFLYCMHKLFTVNIRHKEKILGKTYCMGQQDDANYTMFKNTKEFNTLKSPDTFLKTNKSKSKFY